MLRRLIKIKEFLFGYSSPERKRWVEEVSPLLEKFYSTHGNVKHKGSIFCLTNEEVIAWNNMPDNAFSRSFKRKTLKAHLWRINVVSGYVRYRNKMLLLDIKNVINVQNLIDEFYDPAEH